ncbi:hypothetical protein IUY40_00800 [Flavobacterium sp. ALJ2]|uniref:hypothetical protein n=1 Tax=Flavobacterium sp. ALJ2 TaxID=2786960 RepID=UPI00189E67D9|nr:hypothetical protein [Flavobacterium sp. ALJ2]MBF7090081.1 hypothetical protein [Flavobacterium sp. ALJ2]
MDSNGVKSDSLGDDLTATGNLLTGVSTYFVALEKFAYSNASYVYKYGTTTTSALQLTLRNKEFQLAVAKWAPMAGDLVGWGAAGISVSQYFRGDIGGYELATDLGMTYIGTKGGWATAASLAYFGGKGIWNYYNPENPLFPVPIKH